MRTPPAPKCMSVCLAIVGALTLFASNAAAADPWAPPSRTPAQLQQAARDRATKTAVIASRRDLIGKTGTDCQKITAYAGGKMEKVVDVHPAKPQLFRNPVKGEGTVLVRDQPKGGYASNRLLIKKDRTLLGRPRVEVTARVKDVDSHSPNTGQARVTLIARRGKDPKVKVKDLGYDDYPKGMYPDSKSESMRVSPIRAIKEFIQLADPGTGGVNRETRAWKG